MPALSIALAANAADHDGPGGPPRIEGVVSLAASATLDVPKDWMSVTFSTTRDGADAGAVQATIRQAVDAALGLARQVSQGAGRIEVETGAFSLQPRYSSKGQPSGWQGQAEVVVQGRDMAGIAQLAGRITSLTIERVDYSVSREAREKAESELSEQAIARFRAKAQDVAKAFGYAGWTVREVAVSADAEQGPTPRMFMAKVASASASDQALPVEAGKGTVTVTVNGTVQLAK
ncbi:MAG TPA: SIMPL domain-containing protein [Burkholderiaceae bacterium]|nr:SIMPL domain-containing protein [Burkholderiaceae bacterium]